MFVTSLSGQGLGFEMISAFSGTGLTGLSGLISGYRTINGVRNGLSGNIIETAFGGYWSNLFDWDTSGKIISYTFYGASGAIPVEKTVITTLNVSGQIYPASGVSVFAAVYSGQLSGQPITLISGLTTATFASGSISRFTFSSGVLGGSGGLPTSWGSSGNVIVALNLDKSGYTDIPLSGQTYIASGPFVNATATVNSGLFVTVPIASISGVNSVVPPATLSGVIANSGLFVIVPTSSISGVQAASGLSVALPLSSVSGINAIVPISTLSGVQPISGTFVSVPIASISGVNTAAAVQSGQIYLASGSQVITVVNLDKSGYTVGSNLDKSGYAVSAIGSGLLSGQQVTLVSGLSYTASGINVTAIAVANSGLFVTVPISTISGVNVTATATVQSGQIYLASGSFLFGSGQYYLASGSITANSGLFVTVPIATLSGVQAGSGLFTNIPISTISGVNSVVPLSTLSGIQPISGTFVSVPISTISGVQAASGLNAIVPISNISGLNAVVPPATLSGVVANSGLFVNASVTIQSGQVWLASGQSVLVNSGTSYLASGSIYKSTFASGVLEVEIPYDILKVDASGITGEALHSPLNAQRKLTNKWDTTSNSGFLTVYKEDASTIAYQQALTSQSGANPVTALGDA